MKHILLIASTIFISFAASAQSDTSVKQSFKEVQQQNEADHIHGKEIMKKSLTKKPASVDNVAQPAAKTTVKKKKKKSC